MKNLVKHIFTNPISIFAPNLHLFIHLYIVFLIHLSLLPIIYI